ncbi:hypothetical protein [Litorimonas sp. WD9-15]|uniref:hypothetical protein n=1 Tax=Litorimonas sp. WD9-15 TaxID=3418716 RepID=UPI003D072083
MSVFSDFDWSWRGVRVRETGAEIRFSRGLILDVWRGGLYIIAEALRPKAARLSGLSFAQIKPRPWYLIWGALRQGGLRHEAEGSVVLHFSDQTVTDQLSLDDSLHINGACTDISKSHVAKTFEAIFGYDLATDPETASGPYLEKGEENGVHDATIETRPKPAAAGRVYQRLIDNRTQGGTVLDYRCPTVFGEIPLVFLKERPIDQRFANLNTRVRITTADTCFSNEEIEQISTFCAAMGLDWGGLDILRDAADGRLYIVDVNKTDMGPPLALPLKEKLSAVKTLGLALRDGVESRL